MKEYMSYNDEKQAPLVHPHDSSKTTTYFIDQKQLIELRKQTFYAIIQFKDIV